jgi:ABC-2 type transport system ATP-binding protein
VRLVTWLKTEVQKGALPVKGTEFAISVQGVRKQYAEATNSVALNGFDLDVRPGTVCGLLGPNGAGKTTAVKVLTTLLAFEQGRASVAGFDVIRQARQVRENIGLVGQYAAVDEILTGRQNLVMFARLCHLSNRQAQRRADELLERFGLIDAGRLPVSKYSGS